MKSFFATLALTASVSAADFSRVAQLLNAAPYEHSAGYDHRAPSSDPANRHHDRLYNNLDEQEYHQWDYGHKEPEVDTGAKEARHDDHKIHKNNLDEQEYHQWDYGHKEPEVDTFAKEGRHSDHKIHKNNLDEQEYHQWDYGHKEPEVDTDAKEARHQDHKIHKNNLDEQEYHQFDYGHKEPEVDTYASEARHSDHKIHKNTLDEQEYHQWDYGHKEPEVDTYASEARHSDHKIHKNTLDEQEYHQWDYGHKEPEVDTYASEARHDDHKIHKNEIELLHQQMAMPEDGHCPAGYKRIGCCQCVVTEFEAPKIHGSHDEVDAQPQTEKKADEPKKNSDETVAKAELDTGLGVTASASLTYKKPKFGMSTSDEQARSKKAKQDAKAKSESESKTRDGGEKKGDKSKEAEPKDEGRQSECPEGFKYEVKKSNYKENSEHLESCRMPMSYDLGAGVEHHCTNCHYSFGRWLEPCAEHFKRNGCCTCTPVCPDGMVMDYWEQRNVEKNNYVCLLRLL